MFEVWRKAEETLLNEINSHWKFIFHHCFLLQCLVSKLTHSVDEDGSNASQLSMKSSECSSLHSSDTHFSISSIFSFFLLDGGNIYEKALPPYFTWLPPSGLTLPYSFLPRILKDFHFPLKLYKKWPAAVIKFFFKRPQCPLVQAEDKVPGLVHVPPCGTKSRVLALYH